jgi:hypothetical protein
MLRLRRLYRGQKYAVDGGEFGVGALALGDKRAGIPYTPDFETSIPEFGVGALALGDKRAGIPYTPDSETSIPEFGVGALAFGDRRAGMPSRTLNGKFLIGCRQQSDTARQ